MPLDPSIANPLTVKIADPLEQYGNFLQAQRMQGEIGKMQQDRADKNALNAAYKASLVNGTLDQNALIRNLANSPGASQIPVIEQHFADVGKLKADSFKAQNEGSKAGADAISKALENSKAQLDGINLMDPNAGLQQYTAHVVADSKDPLIAKMNLDRGVTPEQYVQQETTKAQQYAAAGKFPEFVLQKKAGLAEATKQHITSVDFEGHHLLQSTPDHALPGSAATVVPGSQTYTAPNPMMHKAPVTNVNVTVQKDTVDAYGKKSAELHADRDMNLENIARSAPLEDEKLGRMAQLLQSGKVLTGAGSDLKLNYYRALKAAGQTGYDDILNATQEYDKLAAGNVLDQAMMRNKAGLGMRTSVAELNMVKDASVRKNMEPGAQLSIINNARHDLRDAVNEFHTRLGEVKNSNPISTVPKTLAVGPAKNLPPVSAPRPHSSEAGYSKNVALLRANPALASQFDEHYGAGAAKAILGGQ